jgi:type II secretory pathway pseudopilin PulG
MKPMTMTEEKTKNSNLKLKHDDNREQGFTLLETTIALVIMMIVGLGAATLFLFSATNNSNVRDRQLSMAVAQQQLERLRGASFATLGTTVTDTGGADKTVTSAGRSYRVVTTITDTTSSLKTVTVQASPRGVGTTWATNASNFGGVTIVTQRSISTLGPNR